MKARYQGMKAHYQGEGTFISDRLGSTINLVGERGGGGKGW